MSKGSRESLVPSLIAGSGMKGVIDAINKLEQSISAILSFTEHANEVPTGALNDSNVAFILADVPNPSAFLQLYLDGMLMTVGEDYTISGVNITFLSPPQTGSILRVFYRY